MMIPEGILCSKSHEYLLEGENGIYTVGLTDYAVEQLGDIVFIELPEAGTEFAKGEVFATVESVKAASETKAHTKKDGLLKLKVKMLTLIQVICLNTKITKKK